MHECVPCLEAHTHLEQVGISLVVAVGLESIKPEFLVRALRRRGDASSLEAHLTRADFKRSDCIAS